MTAPDPRVALLLGSGQVPQVRVEATLLPRSGGVVPLRVVSGSRRSDVTAIHRHELSVTVVPPADMPRLDLGEPGHGLTVRVGVRVGRSWVWAPQGVGRVVPGASRDRAGAWALTARSWESVIAGAPLLCDVGVSGSALDVLAGLVRDACPGVTFSPDVEDVDLPATRLEASDGTGSRWDAVEKVTAACGWSLWCDRDGVVRVTARDLPVASPAWTAAAATVDRGSSGRDVANVVVVRSQDARWWGIAVDDRPGSPTYVGAAVVEAAARARTRGLAAVPRTAGILGNMVTLDGIGSDAQATQAARGLLAGSLTGPRSVSVSAAWQPWGDPGDVVLIPGDPLLMGSVSNLDVPLTGGGMTMEVRA